MNDARMLLFLAIKRSGTTQTELSKRIQGMSEARLSRIVNGHIEPTDSEKSKISQLLGLQIGELWPKGGNNEANR